MISLNDQVSRVFDVAIVAEKFEILTYKNKNTYIFLFFSILKLKASGHNHSMSNFEQ